jgi:2-keto-4-pentenoate hydratase/2-oxohepta-3-ene-1,7-dioic acid hydratase in catechol pathway
MKICTFIHHSTIGTQSRLGILYNFNNQDIVIDANTCWAADYEREGFFNPYERANDKCPSSLRSLLDLKDDPLDLLQESLGLFLFFEKVGLEKTKSGQPIYFNLKDNEVSLSAPLDKINNYRDFYAHEKHVEVGFKKRNEKIPPEWYEIPAYYKGPSQSFIGPNQEILWPSYTKILDYELELGMIVGKAGKNIKSKYANDHIFGFTILNDISARDIQKKEMQVRLGPSKGKDFCSIIGPVITTYDEFDFKEPDLLMTATVNNQEWSRGQSGDSHYSFAEMIEFVAQDEWVLPGDLFGSGTVGTGCGLELDKWIKPGDVLKLEVENIGILENIVGQPQGVL